MIENLRPATSRDVLPDKVPDGAIVMVGTCADEAPGDGGRPAAPPGDRGAPPAGGASDVVPADAPEVFAADFETDFSEFDTCQAAFVNDDCAGYDGGEVGMQIISDAADGAGAARFVVGPGDVPDFGGGERSEVAGHGQDLATEQ